MREDRKQIILQEIHFWKEHKLLPEVYCDFLIALYTEGEGLDRKQPKAKRPIAISIYLFVIVSLLILSFFVIYIGEQSHSMTLIFLGIFWLFSLFMLILIRRKDSHSFHFAISLLGFLLLTLLHSFYFGTSLLTEPLLKGFIILINFLLWLFISYKTRYKWLMYTSLVGIVLTIIYIVF